MTLTEAGLHAGPGLGLAPVALLFQYMRLLQEAGERPGGGGRRLQGAAACAPPGCVTACTRPPFAQGCAEFWEMAHGHPPCAGDNAARTRTHASGGEPMQLCLRSGWRLRGPGPRRELKCTP